MKVGIASCYYHHNYGSMLQAYATQRAVQALGHQAITIYCASPKQFMTESKIKYYAQRLWQSIKTREALQRKGREIQARIALFFHPDLKASIALRDKLFNQFYREHIILSKPCANRAALTQLTEGFDAVVVGSDQLWSTMGIEQDYFTLTFVSDHVRKIAYATSFGTPTLPKYQHETARKFLQRFHALSVREKSAVSLIKSLEVTKDVQMVLDPTLLFDAESWSQLQNDPNIEGDYILCYFLGINQEHREIACQIQKLMGYKIVALQHLDEYIRADEKFGDIKPYDVGPTQFVNLIRNAAFVCTDSFHGTCFSILHHKSFLTFNRFIEQSRESTNTRIHSLLSLTGLEGRRIGKRPTEDELRKLCFENIDFSTADQQLERERERSFAYLKNALEK